MAETQAVTAKAGALYDLGYQRYTGQRLDRANAVRTLFAFSLRTAFGLGRGARSKVIPSIILGVVFIPAIVSVGAASTTGFTALKSWLNLSVQPA